MEKNGKEIEINTREQKNSDEIEKQREEKPETTEKYEYKKTQQYEIPKILRKTRRFFKIIKELTPLAVTILRDRKKYILFGEPRELTEKEKQERAETFTDKLIELGPTFIKLGQLLSTRPDLLSKYYVKELTRLQDRVPPAPYEEAEKIIKKELGPIEEQFDEFNEHSVKGASLGQVYRAKLNGEEVAVKINRPNVNELIEADIEIMKSFMPLVKKIVGSARAYSMGNIIDEFEKVLKQEMNYKREAGYMEEIRENFKNKRKIKIPEVKWSHTTKNILTMDHIPGTKIKNVEKIEEMNIDKKEIANTIINAYLKMVIRDGIFHADPHPGNIAVTKDGSIVLYDFGMSGEITPVTKQKITRLYLALARKDTRGIIRSLISLGTLKPGVRIDVLEKIAQKEIKQLTEKREEWRAEEILQSAQQVMYKYPFRIPEHLALLIRMAIIIEGECKKLDPEFNFIKATKKYIRRKGIEKEQVERKIKENIVDLEKSLDVATKTPQKLDNLIDQIRRNELEINAQIEDPEKVIKNTGTRIILGMLASASLLFTALTMNQEPQITAIGSTLTAIFLIGLLIASKEEKREIWEPKKPVK